MIPFDQEIALGEQTYNQILKNEKILDRNDTTEWIRKIGSRITNVSAMPNLNWEFNLIESNQKNAFALPGGKVAIYTGLLPVAMNGAGLATIMSHEIAHVIARHGAQRMSRQMVLTAGLMATSIGLDNNKYKNTIMAALGVGIVFGFKLPFSRSHEAEADHIGLTYMARAGYDPSEATRFWRRFADVQNGGSVPEFLSTHPTDKKRIALINRNLTQAKIEYDSSKIKYGLGRTVPLREIESDNNKEIEPSFHKPIENMPIEAFK